MRYYLHNISNQIKYYNKMISIKNLFFITILFLATTTFSQKDEDIEYVFKKYIELNKNYLESMKLTDRKKLENYSISI